MTLPNFRAAVVPRAKTESYLLNLQHPTGHTKAMYFLRFGFTPEQWQVMVEALKRHAGTAEVVKVEETPFGMRYTLQGEIVTPDGRNPTIKTGWVIDESGIPQFATAIPGKRPKGDKP